MNIGVPELLLLGGILLLLFGPSRLPSLGKSIGEAIRSFKKGLNSEEIDVTESSRAAAKAAQERLDDSKASAESRFTSASDPLSRFGEESSKTGKKETSQS